MNPAIVAPDAFDIVDLSVDRGLTSDQRRNLGSVAKVLQYAASNKMFGGENAHLSSLNPYIAKAFKKFRFVSSFTLFYYFLFFILFFVHFLY